MMLFGLFFLSVIGSVHYYIWRRLIKSCHLPKTLHKSLTIALIILGVSLPASMILGRGFSTQVSSLVMYVPFLWLGILMLLFFFLFGTNYAQAMTESHTNDK